MHQGRGNRQGHEFRLKLTSGRALASEFELLRPHLVYTLREVRAGLVREVL